MAQADRIPINVDPAEATPSLAHTLEVKKWSTRSDTCNIASFSLSVSLIVLASAGREAALWTMSIAGGAVGLLPGGERDRDL
ncbi:hypothetical protein N7463_008312 [Penicillium fimorum]|uniref:Uncharacterized protein n=1 Tax=Penicillium fimorum TaxID=1882269 RepID=A0A9W9XPP5_9EURO|nr:hypothetical protein N7463_008312 [Penicillium fimorum]